MQCDPKDLDELYIEAWNRVNDQNRDSRHDAKKALCWLSCSFRQLRVQELRHALATRRGDKAMYEENLMNFDRLVRSCVGLVAVDTRSQIVRLIHQTAQDFFETRASEYFPDAHTRLTRTCLTYLLFDEFSQGPCDTTSALEDPIATTRIISTRLKRKPFMDYAAQHWGDHARGRETERALEHEILDFLRTPRALASSVQVKYGHGWSSLEWSLDGSKHTPIHVVVSFALEYILEALLKTVTAKNLNVEDGKRKTAFHWAVELDRAVCARSLLKAGADIRTQDNNGSTAVSKACLLRRASILDMILEHDKTAEFSAEEISCAILFSQNLFLERYLQVAPRPAMRATAMLMESSVLGKPEIIALAISFGADINVEDRRGCTPLLRAVENGRSAAAEALVTAGASTTVLDTSGKTMLQVAVSSQKMFGERVSYMAQFAHAYFLTGGIFRPSHAYRVDVPIESCQNSLERFRCLFENENTPAEDPGAFLETVDALYEDGEHPSIIRLLLSRGADPSVKTSEGETVLHLAIVSASRVKVLLDVVPVLDINAQDNQGRSALHHAAASGNHFTMEVLVANGANINMRDLGGASALHYAVNHPHCVQMAIRHGISMMTVDSWKRAILHYLVMMKKPRQEVVELFLEAGADSDTVDSQGKTASDYRAKCHTGPHGFEQTISWIDTPR